MGSWFSNLHIRKSGHVTMEAVVSCIHSQMARCGYEPAVSERDADAAVAVISMPEGQWISVCSEQLAHDDSESCKGIAMPISQQLCTDVLGIACFDSDYLYLNLINAEEQVDAWVGIGHGKDVGIDRRTGVTAWKKKVADYPAFSAAAKQKYICAEQFLTQAEPCLGLPAVQGMMTLREAESQGKTEYLYYRLKEASVIQEASKLVLNKYDAGIPCLVDRCSKLSIYSVGTESHGLSVYFSGPGVEDGTLTFSDVCLGRNGQLLPINLEKMQLPDGQWAYGYHDPCFPIPVGPSRRLKWEKQWPLMVERRIGLEFIPRGDPRKALDITVIVVPDHSPEGQIWWNVWKPWGSKGAFIDHHNQIWKRVRAVEGDESQCLPLLKEEDFVSAPGSLIQG